MQKSDLLEADIGRRFQCLVVAWKAAQGVSSSLTEMVAQPAYQEIISMGPAAVPYLLTELGREPDWWFAALQAITGEDPVAPGSRGRLAEMARAWLEWGRARGINC